MGSEGLLTGGNSGAGGGGGVGGGTLLGAYAARPLASSVPSGTVYQTTDGITAFISDGATWFPMISGRLGVQPPAASIWSAVNVAGRLPQIDGDDAGGLCIAAGVPFPSIVHPGLVPAGGPDFRILKRAMPLVAFTVQAHIVAELPPNAQGIPYFGLIFRSSTTGQVDAWGNYAGGPAQASGTVPTGAFNRNWNTASDATAAPASMAMAGFSDFHINAHYSLGNGVWLALSYDPAGNKTYQFSTDGKHWHVVLSVARYDQFVPDEIGFCIASLNDLGSFGGGDCSATALLDSWQVTTP